MFLHRVNGGVSEIALIVDDRRQRLVLEQQLVCNQHYVSISCDSKSLSKSFQDHLDQPDAWVVLLNDTESERALSFIQEESASPCLVLDSMPDEESDVYERWEGQWKEKLSNTLHPVIREELAAEPDHVYLLAASLGGPEAIVRFFKTLDRSLPIAFVYAQHIEESFELALQTSIKNVSQYSSRVFDGGGEIKTNEVLILSPEYRPRFLPFGNVIKSKKKWSMPYSPCINDVGTDLANRYRSKLTMIVFTGTCDDGSIAARVIKDQGGDVWVQSSSTCISPNMPEAATATNTVSFIGSPEQLAERIMSVTNSKIPLQESIHEQGC